jgi:hypothetical protein
MGGATTEDIPVDCEYHETEQQSYEVLQQKVTEKERENKKLRKRLLGKEHRVKTLDELVRTKNRRIKSKERLIKLYAAKLGYETTRPRKQKVRGTLEIFPDIARGINLSDARNGRKF